LGVALRLIRLGTPAGLQWSCKSPWIPRAYITPTTFTWSWEP